MVLYLTPTHAPRGTAHRLDQFDGLVERLPGASFLDLGCNRGLYAIQAALAGAKVVHGCDAYAPGVEAAQQVLADFRDVDVHFEALDLSLGPTQLVRFRPSYDIVFLSGVVHKIIRQMEYRLLVELIRDIGQRVGSLLIWRGYLDEVDTLDVVFGGIGLRRTHLVVSDLMGPTATWTRQAASAVTRSRAVR